MPKKKTPDLSAITVAQASEIHRSAPDGMRITDYDEEGQVITVCNRPNSRTVVIEKARLTPELNLILTDVARLFFDEEHSLRGFHSSYMCAHRGLRKVIYQRTKAGKAEIARASQTTATALIEEIFKELEQET